LSGQIPHPRSSRLTAVGLRENNCVFRLRQSSGAQFYLFHSAAPNFKREPTATAVVGRKASREHIPRYMSTQLECASESVMPMPRAPIAARSGTECICDMAARGFFGNEIHNPVVTTKHTAGDSHPQYRRSGRQGDGDTRSACALPRRRLFAGTYDALLKRRQSLASKALRPGRTSLGLHSRSSKCYIDIVIKIKRPRAHVFDML
jgi:hypothetical protein